MQSRKKLFKYGAPFLILGVFITAFIAVIGSPANITAVTPAAEEIKIRMLLELVGDTQGDIQGEVTDAGHEGMIEVLGFSHQVVSPRDAASGLPTGKRQHSPVRITKRIDKASPLLFTVLCTNEEITAFTLHMYRPNAMDVMEEYYTIELEGAHIGSIQDQGGFGYGETVAFYYTKITWTYIDGGITAEDDWEEPISY